LEPRLSPQLRQPSRRRQRQGLDTETEQAGEAGGPGFSPPDPAG
jgi:hypothetical protein